ncbi:hypothetical protein [Streptomyces sp. CAU 1734]|uniref:hypothetical protein n=1 Tax=Streptomyces sp. CAU 1734 TaxID=3140360 RepID=UPI0032619113
MSGTDDLMDTERTTEELADAMSSGNVIKVLFGHLLTFEVSLSGVAVFVRHELSEERITDLAEGAVKGELRLTIAPSAHDRTQLLVDVGEAGLLDRALAARKTLVGG